MVNTGCKNEHQTCKDCLDKIKQKNNTCPFCRDKLSEIPNNIPIRREEYMTRDYAINYNVLRIMSGMGSIARDERRERRRDERLETALAGERRQYSLSEVRLMEEVD